MDSKLSLSPAEESMVKDREVILTKNRILKKVEFLLSIIGEEITQHPLPSSIPFSTPKISKGENYLGFPWMVLDYPRVSSGDGILFIRTFFWWGNYFSSTLHLSGEFSNLFRKKLQEKNDELESYLIGVNEDPWVHKNDETNYLPFSSETEIYLEKYDHIKLARFWSLEEWSSEKGVEAWKNFVQLIS